MNERSAMINSYLISGASGFIGKSVVKELLTNDKIVYALVRNPNKLNDLFKHKNLKIINLDLQNINKLSNILKENRIDVFVHLGNSAIYPDENQDYKAQLQNTLYACDALTEAVKLNIKKFVLVGSSYQYQKNDNKYYEEFRNSSVYGAARLSALKLCEVIAHNSGIEFNSVLLTNCFGIGDYSHRSSNAIIHNFLSKNTPSLIKGDNRHDWIYIDDFVRGLLLVIEKGINFKSYYLGHRHLKSFKSIIMNTRDIVAPGLSLEFGSYKDNAYIDYSMIDLNAAYKDLGFECNVEFDVSIKKTVAWIKESGLFK